MGTQNVMLSEPGATCQEVHTDSSWRGRAQRDPKPHYFTVLVPLVDQDAQTGGTRLFPRTHRDVASTAVEAGGSVRGVEEPMRAGDALVFDGLLQHFGTANGTGRGGLEPVKRYFYYA